MVNSYRCKSSMNTLTTLNRDNYFRGYKIGYPGSPFCICIICKDKPHPACKTSNY